MTCIDTIRDYGLRAIGHGEKLLPQSDITLCEQFVLIGSGILWNIYFAAIAVFFGFWLAVILALGKNSHNPYLRKPASAFIFIFRGSPLFIQFFFAYELFVLLPKVGIEFSLGPITLAAELRWLSAAWLGALVVLFFNTASYSGNIFYGALQAIPKGDLEAADAYGMSPAKKFRRVVWPTMLRLAWPSYTNEAIFLFHATALVFFSAFPSRQQSGDSLYYASYFADKTFNPFVPYPIVALYFILMTLVIILIFGKVNQYLNKHLPKNQRARLKMPKQMMR
ncbi:MAG: amino acid ABC transporter permease [Alphaproteobacteria bacterium]